MTPALQEPARQVALAAKMLGWHTTLLPLAEMNPLQSILILAHGLPLTI
jgi:hypothetical protein